MIELKDIRFRYASSQEETLKGINLTIEEGEVLLLTGKSGCGKTTLTRLVNGLLPDFFKGELGGEILIDGKNVRNLKIHQVSDMVGSVFQDPRSQFFTTDTTAEMSFSCENAAMPPELIRKRVAETAHDLSIEGLLDKDIFTLSSGEKQLVAIGSVYSFRPKIFVLDEPSANLDDQATETVRQALLTLKDKGCTVIVSEHRIHYLRNLVDRVIIMEDGAIAKTLNKSEFQALTNEDAAQLGLRCVDLNAVEIPDTHRPHPSNPSLELESVSFAYPEYENVLDKISFSVQHGEIVGIVGHNGAGKSSLTEIICGLREEQGGVIRVDGKRFLAKQRMGSSYYVMQDADYQLFTESVEEELLLGSARDEQTLQKAEYIMELLGLTAFRSCHPGSLSGGQKQRVSIAVAYMKDADIICFDEPTSGLDLENMQRTGELLRTLAQQGKTILVVSHDYELLTSHCTRIIRIDEGSVADDLLVAPENTKRMHQSFKYELGGDRIERKKKPGLGRLLEIAGEKKTMLVGSGVLSTLNVLFMLVPFYAIFNIMNELLHNAADITGVDGNTLIFWAIVGFVGMLLGYACLYAGGMLSHVAAFRILYGIRIKIATHIGTLPLGFFNRNSAGKIKTVVEADAEKLEGFIAHHLPDLISAIVMFFALSIAMFMLDPLLAVACLVPIVIGYVAQFSMMMGKKARASMVEYFNAQEEINSSSLQYIKGMPSIKIFGQTVHSFRKFYSDMVKYRDFCVEYSDNFQFGFVLFRVLLFSVGTFILPVGVFLLSGDPDNMSFALVLLLFLVAAPGITTPVIKLNNLASSMRMIMEGVSRIDAILDEKPIEEARVGTLPIEYDISFKGVSFSYDGKREVLENIDFTAKQNEITALVGPSGSGKSTIAQLIPRFWDVSEGCIRIGGVNIKDIPSEELMQALSFVFQDSFLFADTIYGNISLGRPDATRDEVLAAAQAARCHEFIERLPQGYNTRIGEGGVYLSGGEEQRVSVARAILKDAPILVLDEATAYADPENEHQMQEALGELIKNKTVIIIAHRLATIQNAQNIIVLNKGVIQESGLHEDLILKGGLYASMWKACTEASSWELSRKQEQNKEDGCHNGIPLNDGKSDNNASLAQTASGKGTEA